MILIEEVKVNKRSVFNTKKELITETLTTSQCSIGNVNVVLGLYLLLRCRKKEMGCTEILKLKKPSKKYSRTDLFYNRIHRKLL